ncbi:hypothetical protein GIY62_06095 [Burkholderia plantarii]|uniref:host specificity factor TipJ family phage tail protein n=1 Tax=Burkholderia plantarii TaxID=41899 RepID=UPI00272CDFA5|nr:host specificity factor TipJ family phage tail protein [Burkholderia plantarii]WLE60228.1 hypothetical protein GIY62_06095 [Burkholderia plantarii]
MSMREWSAHAGVDMSRSIVCVNGDYWLRDDWDREIPFGAIVAVEPVAGGGGGSSPLQIVLEIAVIAASIFVPGSIGLVGFAAKIAGAAIAIAGSALVNAVVPPPRANASVTAAAASPTYQVQSTGNSARLLDAIPVWYGRMKGTPDLASQPYTEFVGNQQYLYELFCITQGELQIESILIGDTPIGNFSEIDFEIVGPNQPVTLFPDNVVTSSDITGIELQAPNDSGGWVGPYTASLAGTKANFIGIDVALPTGLFYANDDGSFGVLALTFEVQAREIDDDGNALTDWIELDSRELKMSANQPQSLSYRYAVAPARYEVRARRTTNLNTDTRAQNRIQWVGMRAYLPSDRYYGDATLLAIRARATNNLNSNTAHDVNVIGTRMLPVWDGVGWTQPRPCRSIAWAFADACKNPTYGAGLEDKRIDLDTLFALDQVWTARGDRFDGVFDTKGTFWDGLTTIGACGRAVPMYFGSVVSIVRDEQKTVRTAIFTPDNMTAGSLSIQYSFYAADTPDYVVVQYLDETTWTWQDVSCIPAGSHALNAATVKMIGITSRDQAWREGIYRAYANRDQRRQISLTSELDGLLVRYGDLVGVSHDLPEWGISGTVECEAAGVVYVDQQLEWTPGAQHYVYFVTASGAPTDPLRVHQPVGDTEFLSMNLVDPLPDDFCFSDGFSADPTRFCFGPATDRAMQDCRLISAAPNDSGQVDLVFVNAADSPHTAETLLSPPAPVSPSLLPGVVHAPIVAEVSVDARVVPGSVVVTATAAQGATLYEFDASANAGASWQLLGTSTSNTMTVPSAVGDWIFRVRAFGVSGLPGPFATWTGTVQQFAYPPEPPTLSLREPFMGDQLSIEIDRRPGVDFYVVDVVVGGVIKYEATITAQNFTWTLAQAQQYGAVAGSFDVRVVAGNIGGQSAPGAITVQSVPPDAPAVTIVPGSTGSATLTMSSAGAVKAVGFVIRQGGSVVYDGPGPSHDVPAGAQYSVTAYNDWRSESAATAVDVPVSAGNAPPPGSGGG